MAIYASLGNGGWEYTITTNNRVTFGELNSEQARELLKLMQTLAPNNVMRTARRDYINARLSA